MIASEFWYTSLRFWKIQSRITRRQFNLSLSGLILFWIFYIVYESVRLSWGSIPDLKFFWIGISCVLFLSLCIRRMHDTGHKCFWVLIPVSVLYLIFRRSTEDNKWGYDFGYLRCPEDFESMTAYYDWYDKRPVYKHWILTSVFKQVIGGVLLLGIAMCISTGAEYAKGLNTSDYFFSGSKEFKVPNSDDYKITDLSVKDVMVVKFGEGMLTLWESEDGVLEWDGVQFDFSFVSNGSKLVDSEKLAKEFLTNFSEVTEVDEQATNMLVLVDRLKSISIKVIEKIRSKI